MQMRAIARAAKAVQERTGDAPLVEVMHPLVGFAEEFRRLHELTVARLRRGGAGGRVPRRDDDRGAAGGAPRGRDRASRREFFSFGTNDLTQTDARRSRATTPRASSSRTYLEDGVLERNPFETLDERRRRRPDADRGRARPRGTARPEARHLRRARRRAALDRLLPRPRPRLRLVLAVPRPARAPRRRAGRVARRRGSAAVRRRRAAEARRRLRRSRTGDADTTRSSRPSGGSCAGRPCPASLH